MNALDIGDIEISVRVAPRFWSKLDLDPTIVSQAVTDGLHELVRTYGLIGRPMVNIAPEERLTQLVRITVGGQDCGYSAQILGTAAAYIQGAVSVPAATASSADSFSVDQFDTENSTEFLILVCREAIAAHAGILVPDRPNLRRVLDLRISLQQAVHAEPFLSAIGMPVPDDQFVERILAGAAPASIAIHLEPSLLRLFLAQDSTGELVPYVRDSFFEELGVLLPNVRLIEEEKLRENCFILEINGVPAIPMHAPAAGTLLVNAAPESLAADIKVAGLPATNPANARPASIVSSDHKELIEAHGYTFWNSSGYVILALAAAIRGAAASFVRAESLQAQLDSLKDVLPTLCELAGTRIPFPLLACVQRSLLRERISVRNLPRILELLLRCDTEGVTDPVNRMNRIRWGLSDLIFSTVSRHTDSLVAYLLSPELEAEMIALDTVPEPEVQRASQERICAAVREHLGELTPTMSIPALVSPDRVRPALAESLRYEFPTLAVVGFGDIPRHVNVQPIARI